MVNSCRYLFFAGDNYYPRGGWADYQCAYDDFDAARSAALAILGLGMPGDFFPSDWSHVVDMTTGKIVFQSARHERVIKTDTGHKREVILHSVLFDYDGVGVRSELTI